MKVLLTRRSIRRYTDEPISAEDEALILKAAMNAPNTSDNRAWAFVVVREREMLQALSKALHPNGPCLANAAMGIVVCGDMSLVPRGLDGYWTQDCSAATENLLLAAHALGLGAVWLGGYPDIHKERPLAKLLNLPRHIIPLCVVALGHPAEEKRDLSDERFESAKIHHEKWEER